MQDRDNIAQELASVFKILAHRDRILIVETLRFREVGVTQLAEALNLGATRVSQHLALMRAHRMVEERRDGRRVLYSLAQSDLAHWITDGLQFVEARAAADRINSRVVNTVRQEWVVGDDGRDGVEK